MSKSLLEILVDSHLEQDRQQRAIQFEHERKQTAISAEIERIRAITERAEKAKKDGVIGRCPDGRECRTGCISGCGRCPTGDYNPFSQKQTDRVKTDDALLELMDDGPAEMPEECSHTAGLLIAACQNAWGYFNGIHNDSAGAQAHIERALTAAGAPLQPIDVA